MKRKENLNGRVKKQTTKLRMANKQLQEEKTAWEPAERVIQKAREYAESIVETGNWESPIKHAFL